MPKFKLTDVSGKSWFMNATNDDVPAITFEPENPDPGPVAPTFTITAVVNGSMWKITASVTPTLAALGTWDLVMANEVIEEDLHFDYATGEYTVDVSAPPAPGAYVLYGEYFPPDNSNFTQVESNALVLEVADTEQYPTFIEGANTVTINGISFPLAAIDPPADRNKFPASRGWEEVIIYTRRDGKTQTATNVYGREVPVLDGKTTTGVGVNLTTIPVGGYVVSAHGARGAELASAAANAGATVTVTKRVILPPPPATPGKLAPWIVSGYWQQYQGPSVEEVMIAAPGYNLALAAFGLGNGAANITFTPETYPSYQNNTAKFKADVKAHQERGCVWGLSIGGGVPREYSTFLRNTTEVDQAFRTLVPIINEYGFQALDYDLENGPAGFNGASMLDLSRRLKDKYGSDFAIIMTPRPYEDFYFDIAVTLHNANVLDLVQLQFYDAAETRDLNFLRSWIPSRVNALVNRGGAGKGVPVSKVVPGTIVWPGYPYGWNTVDNYLDIIKGIKGIRGGMTWEFSLDKKTGTKGWDFSKKFAAAAPA